MKKFGMFFVLMFLSTFIFAQVDSTLVQQIGDFVGTLFGASAKESVMSIIFKVIGVLAALDGIIVIALTFIPTTSPARSILEKVFSWLRSIIGDKKKGGGTFDKNE